MWANEAMGFEWVESEIEAGRPVEGQRSGPLHRTQRRTGRTQGIRQEWREGVVEARLVEEMKVGEYLREASERLER